MDSNVLIVDDHRDILRLLHSTLDTLKKKEIKITEAPSGEEALLESGRHKIDLLITDYMLPGMSGVELMHKVRARHPEVKIIFITGMTDKKNGTKCSTQAPLPSLTNLFLWQIFWMLSNAASVWCKLFFLPKEPANKLKIATRGYPTSSPISGRM